MPTPLLELLDVSCSLKSEDVLFDDVNIRVDEGDIVIIQGRSGSGKSTLLKCIGHLVTYTGHILYRGKTTQQVGIPLYRTRVLYVPQRPSLLPGSPVAFLKTILGLAAHQAHLEETSSEFKEVYDRALKIGHQWAIDPELWERNWTQLSGGEAQRLLLAVAVALNTAEVLLLDEPTSALDAESSHLVEEYLSELVTSGSSMLKAIVWITHSAEQGRRVGTKWVYFSRGTCSEDSQTSSMSGRSATASV